MTMRELCLKYGNDPNFIKELNSIKDSDSYRLAKKQENLFIKYSEGFLDRLNNEYFNNKQFDSELDRKFGDFKGKDNNYYDLKVGLTELCGSIGLDSLRDFGDTKTNRHKYVCINKDLSNFYIIDAKELKEKVEEKIGKSIDKLIEEKEKEGSNFTHIGEKFYKELI